MYIDFMKIIFYLYSTRKVQYSVYFLKKNLQELDFFTPVTLTMFIRIMKNKI